ncbi:MAG: hypothetical protein V3V31_06710 [Methylococcales bacterium]
MRGRRTIEDFNLSFLDVISCGFGAVILLLVLSRFAEPVVIEEMREDLDKQLVRMEQEIVELSGETRTLNRDLSEKNSQLSQEKRKLARLQGLFSTVKGEFTAAKDTAQIKEIIEGKLQTAHQELSDEMKRLYGQGERSTKSNSNIGGIPVDSEYIIFIIDTSGSMFNYSWRLVLRKIEETLAIYPKVKGIQVMNDMGNYLFSQYRGRWIPDSKARRKAILKRLNRWSVFSNSSPVEGITRAIQTFHAKDKKISLYVFGDEFTGSSIDSVVEAVDRINKVGRKGQRRVRIHGVGFPVVISQPPGLQQTGIRFATLMRILCERNGGTFVGLNRYGGI